MAFQNIVIHSSKEERAKVELPSEFSKAWLYLTMAIIYGSKDDPKWNSRMKRAEDLIEKGSKKFLQGLSEKSLLEKAAVLPLEVLSLATMGLLQDQVGKSDDICDTYSQYLNSLVSCVCFTILWPLANKFRIMQSHQNPPTGHSNISSIWSSKSW
jgi:hypothetical protein